MWIYHEVNEVKAEVEVSSFILALYTARALERSKIHDHMVLQKLNENIFITVS